MSSIKIKSKFLNLFLIGGLFLIFSIGFSKFIRKPFRSPVKVEELISEKPIKAVAALGQLLPLGDIHKLAAPTTSFGGTPRILSLEIVEGDLVSKNQVLAVFDNQPQIIADIKTGEARIRSLDNEIKMKVREVERYQMVVKEGATAIIILEEKQKELTKLEGARSVLEAELQGLQADYKNTELKSPIDGVVLKLHTLEGERPGIDGVLEIGANKVMQALIEVYESDINRIALGQLVTLVSENGGFSGKLSGEVNRISPQIRQRRVISTDPTGDADARIVEVLVGLDSISSQKVRNLTGMKVIARFQAL